jgi:hypothetical protein
MKRNKKQIKFEFFSDYEERLKGKVISGVAFCNTDEQHFTITFTDDTYISIGLDYDEDNREWRLCDNCIDEPSCINGGRLDSWVDDNGNLHFYKWCQELIRLGIWNVTEAEVKALIDKHKAEEEKREYETYLRLKEKYEKPA